MYRSWESSMGSEGSDSFPELWHQNKNKSKTFHKCHPVSWQQQKLLLAICLCSQALQSKRTMQSAEPKEKYLEARSRPANTRSPWIFKAEPTAVGVGWLGRTLFSNVGSEKRWEQLSPPYLRSRADQTASEQPRGRGSESCRREKTRPTACLSVARLIGWNCGANQLKAAVVAALLR